MPTKVSAHKKRKRTTTKRKTAKSARSTAKKSTKATKSRTKTKKISTKRAATKRSSTRKYSPTAQKEVENEMRKYKRGTAKSGKGGAPVKSRKQAIAIGLSKARAKGEKVPKKSSR